MNDSGGPKGSGRSDLPAWLSLPVTIHDGGPFETAFAGSDDDATRFCVCPDRPVHGQADEGEAPLRCGNCGKAIAGSVAPSEAERLLVAMVEGSCDPCPYCGSELPTMEDRCADADCTLENAREYLQRRGLLPRTP